MSAFPSSAMGLPSALKYDLPPSMDDSARSYSVNVAPDGITQVAGALGNISFTANTVVQSQFNPQVVSFTIPSGMSDDVFMDAMNTTLSFTLTYTVGTAASVTGGVCKLLSSASSFFDSLVLYSNNTPLETINQYGLLSNYLLQNTVNYAERYGGIGVCMGADSNSANGIDLATATAGTYRYNFCIPLISLISLPSSSANFSRALASGSFLPPPENKRAISENPPVVNPACAREERPSNELSSLPFKASRTPLNVSAAPPTAAAAMPSDEAKPAVAVCA
jgi:hypothetical protein